MRCQKDLRSMKKGIIGLKIKVITTEPPYHAQEWEYPPQRCTFRECVIFFTIITKICLIPRNDYISVNKMKINGAVAKLAHFFHFVNV